MEVKSQLHAPTKDSLVPESQSGHLEKRKTVIVEIRTLITQPAAIFFLAEVVLLMFYLMTLISGYLKNPLFRVLSLCM
jgi:hypothetical protein